MSKKTARYAEFGDQHARQTRLALAIFGPLSLKNKLWPMACAAYVLVHPDTAETVRSNIGPHLANAAIRILFQAAQTGSTDFFDTFGAAYEAIASASNGAWYNPLAAVLLAEQQDQEDPENHRVKYAYPTRTQLLARVGMVSCGDVGRRNVETINRLRKRMSLGVRNSKRGLSVDPDAEVHPTDDGSSFRRQLLAAVILESAEMFLRNSASVF